MQAKAYKTKSGRQLFRPVEVEDSKVNGMSLDDPGFCLGCGNEAFGVEPDARKYNCESCGEPLVYGMHELLLMGLVTLRD